MRSRIQSRTAEEEENILKESQRSLKRNMNAANKSHWRVLCVRLEMDKWGQGYRKGMYNMGLELPCSLTIDTRKRVLGALLPKVWDSSETVELIEERIGPFIMEELEEACGRIKVGEAGRNFACRLLGRQ